MILKLTKMSWSDIGLAMGWMKAAAYKVIDTPFNQSNYPSLIGKILSEPPAYAEVVPAEETPSGEECFKNPADTSGLIVDMKLKPKGVPPRVKNAVNKKLQAIGDFHDGIPLSKMFDILKSEGLVPIAEDGTPWEGLLCGGKECGHPEASNQHATFETAVKFDDTYYPARAWLHITWCKMPSGKMEVIKYLS